MELSCLEQNVLWEGETALVIEYTDGETGDWNRAELVSSNGQQYLVIKKGAEAG